MITAIVINIIGWLGSALVLTAYILNLTGRLTIKSVWYPFLNIVGGLFCIVNTGYYGAYPSSFANTIWVIIAFIAIYNIKRKKLA